MMPFRPPPRFDFVQGHVREWDVSVKDYRHSPACPCYRIEELEDRIRAYENNEPMTIVDGKTIPLRFVHEAREQEEPTP